MSLSSFDDHPPTGPTYVPISLQITSEPFLSGETSINLLITPQSSSESSSMSFAVHFYTIASITPSGPNATAQFNALPQSVSHYFSNVPTEIPLFGNNASCALHVLPTITELAGQTLVITITSSESTNSMAAVTLPVVAAVTAAPLLKAA